MCNLPKAFVRKQISGEAEQRMFGISLDYAEDVQGKTVRN